MEFNRQSNVARENERERERQREREHAQELKSAFDSINAKREEDRVQSDITRTKEFEAMVAKI